MNWMAFFLKKNIILSYDNGVGNSGGGSIVFVNNIEQSFYYSLPLFFLTFLFKCCIFAPYN